MNDKIYRKLFLGFFQIHILHHAKQEKIYGAYMIDELKHHGYHVGPSHIYPLLHEMVSNKLLNVEEQLINGKIRKYYSITSEGLEVLDTAINMVKELTHEVINHV